MNFTIHQLRIFTTICDLQSITKTSEQLFLTQPAVSIQLKKFQDQFDIPLTTMKGRQIAITDFGMSICEVSKRILNEVDNIQITTNQYKGLLSGKLSFSVVSTGKYVLPYILSNFKDAHPLIDISINVTNKQIVTKNMIDKTDDFYLVSVLPMLENTESIKLIKNDLYLVGSTAYIKSHIKKKMTHSVLSNHSLILREQGSATRSAMESYLLKHGITLQNTMELVSNEAVKQAVNAGLGLSIMPLIGLKNELTSGEMSIIPIKGLPITTEWQLVYNMGTQMSPVKKAFIDYINEVKIESLSTKFSWTKNFK